MAADDLYAAAASLLGQAAAALGVEAPTRQYVAVGAPAAECDQLTVHALGPLPFLGAASQPLPSVALPRVWQVPLVVMVLRCTPPGFGEADGPTLADFDAVARQSYRDAWTLWNALYHHHQDGTLLAPPWRSLGVDAGVPVEPQGMVVGWQLTCTVEQDGYAG